jgi:trimeric autotransporter adhesin
MFIRRFVCICLAWFAMLLPLAAQTSSADQTSTANSAATIQVPPLIRLSGTLNTPLAPAANTVVNVTFSLYQEETGGTSLWQETQNVELDATGRYTVLLGATQAEGLPIDLFTSGQAQWLGVRPAGQAEQPRIMLVSVPFALKAGDAQTIGGLPPSAFALANGSAGAAESAKPATTATASNAAKKSAPPSNPDVTGMGTIDYIPMWDTTSDIIDSIIYQKSSEIGIDTTTPAALLDVNGKTDIRDTLTLYPKSTDNTLSVNGTSFKISSTGEVTFVSGQTYPGAGTITGITTASGSGLSGGGTTGTLSLKVPSAGITNAMLAHSKITLNASTAGGLTIPGAMTLGGTYTIGLKTCSANQLLQYVGTAWTCSSTGTGTITGITTASGSGLAGGGTSGTLTLSVPAAGITNAMLKSSSLTVTAGTDLTGGGSVALGATTTLNLDTTKVPQLNAANMFTGDQAITGTLSATSSAAGAFAVSGTNSATTGTSVGVYGTTASAAGYAVYGLNSATTGNATGVSGVSESTSGIGVLGSAEATTGTGYGVMGTTTTPDGSGVYGSTDNVTATGVSGENSATTGDAVGVSGISASSSGNGVYGSNTDTTGKGSGGVGVYGETSSPNGAGVYGANSATTGYAYGVYGRTSSTDQYATAVLGLASSTSGETYGVSGQTNSTTAGAAAVNGYVAATTGTAAGVQGKTDSTSQGATGVYGYEGAATGLVYGVYGKTASTTQDASAVYGYEAATTGDVAGVYGYTASTTYPASGVTGYEGAATGQVFGVIGQADSTTNSAAAVSGYETAATGAVDGVIGGVASTSQGAAGVFGYDSATSGDGVGVGGEVSSPDGAGGYFINTSDDGGYVVEGQGPDGVVFSVNNSGDGEFSGTVTCSGCSSEIDDPVDAANKYLYHSSVQSPDMMNVYNGNITTNANGVATVALPNYFEALNREFRYQLTVIGQFAQAIVAQEISQNQFTIKTNQPNVKVSWQVTGIRQDPWANAHRIPSEVAKPANKRGYYVHPELYGAGPDKSIHPGLVTLDVKTRIPSHPQLQAAAWPAPTAPQLPPARLATRPTPKAPLARPATRPAPNAPPVKPARPATQQPLAPQVRPTPASVTSRKSQSTP